MNCSHFYTDNKVKHVLISFCNSIITTRSVFRSAPPLHLSFSLFSVPISATSFLIIMTWLVLEVLMVVLERGVGVEERGGRAGGGIRLLLLAC